MSSSKSETDQELERLYRKAQDELSHYKDHNSIKRAGGWGRDVMVHIAVTIMPDRDGHHVLGERENEIGQFAVRIPYQWVERGITPAQAKAMFEGLNAEAFKRMRLYGLTRA